MATITWKTTTDILADAKSKKIDDLKAKCASVIQAGFTSNALGTSHTYIADPTSMIYWNATVQRFQTDPTFTSVDWSTADASFLTHTKDQFMQAFHDGHQFGLDQEAHLASLVANVMDPTTDTVAKVDAITWS